MMLLKLVKFKNNKFDYQIISLSDYGKLQNDFNKIGIKVYNLNLNKKFVKFFKITNQTY